MEKRKIGSLEVSVVGLGTNNFGRRMNAEGSARVVHAALDAGINFFDTADVYGNGQSEGFIARALGSRRSQAVIATKFGSHMEGQGSGGSAGYLRQAIEASLRRLQTDYIDLYQIHTPDPHVPIAETLGALDQVVKAGKVREIGCSNFSAEQLGAAVAAVRPGGARFVSVQNEYNLLKRDPEQGVLEMCERLGLAFLPYFPLASGLLTGKYRQGQPVPAGTRLAGGTRPAVLNEHNLAIVESLISFAETHGHTLLELAFSWLLTKPIIASVIAGATQPQQVRANAAAANWNLTPDVLAAIDRILLQQA